MDARGVGKRCSNEITCRSCFQVDSNDRSNFLRHPNIVGLVKQLAAEVIVSSLSSFNLTQ